MSIGGADKPLKSRPLLLSYQELQAVVSKININYKIFLFGYVYIRIALAELSRSANGPLQQFCPKQPCKVGKARRRIAEAVERGKVYSFSE